MNLLRPVITATLIFLVFFILLFVYTKLAGPLPFSVNSITTTKSDVFYVNGEGSVSIPPDVAIVNAGVQVSADSNTQVQEQLNASINKVSEAVKALGVKSEDIKTSNYNISPITHTNGAGQTITGYSASSNLNIKVKDISKVNQVIDAATRSGANVLGGVSFVVDDPTRAENEAREKAVADAKEKAENAANIAGFRLGRIINYSENFGGIMPYALDARVSNSAAKEIAPPTSVEPGSNEVRVTVTLSYEIL